MAKRTRPLVGLLLSLAVLVAVPVALPRLLSGGAGDREPRAEPGAVPAAPAAPATPAAPAGPAGPVTEQPARPTVPSARSSTPAPARPRTAPAARAAPVRLVVPAVGVDAPVDRVGVDPAGLMGLPPDVRRVGWYRFGAAPGDGAGSAVLAGHRDSRTQGRGELWDLGRAERGQRVEVTMSDGRRLAYEIVAVDRTAKAALGLDALFRRDGDPVLQVVTCGGEYVRDRGGYQDNIVVTARPVRAP